MAALWFYVLAPQETERPETADILWERNCQMTNCAGQKKMLGGVLPWHPLLHSFETGPLVEPGARLVPQVLVTPVFISHRAGWGHRRVLGHAQLCPQCWRCELRLPCLLTMCFPH